MRKFFVWALAILLTVGASIYQRQSGPTYPLKISEIPGDKDYKMKLIRSASIGEQTFVEIPVSEAFDSAVICFHKYPIISENTIKPFKKEIESWKVVLPDQPPAGKLQYYIILFKNGRKIMQTDNNSAIIRFKGQVPDYILIPHILAMFAAMLFSLVSLFSILLKTGNYRLFSYLTVITLIIGGFILGPIMQNYAFGDYWTGWPIGKDFTDNKTLIALIIWVLAIILNFKKDRKWAIIMAAVSMLVVFSIPHSLGGSEYNYESGQVETGKNN
ncbi:MAG: hypothetical protein PHW82_03845 [Bacteroidales bacterium]|nr:hypothetical protein [Bacteroidales bacterium]